MQIAHNFLPDSTCACQSVRLTRNAGDLLTMCQGEASREYFVVCRDCLTAAPHRKTPAAAEMAWRNGERKDG